MSRALHWIGLGLACAGSASGAALVLAQIDAAGAWGLAICGAVAVAMARETHRSRGVHATDR